MKIFIVFERWPYEEAEIIRVFENEADAAAFVKEKQDQANKRRWHYEEWSVE